jgi:hypothetical protein
VEERQVIPAPTADQLDAWMRDPVLGTARPFVPRPKRKAAADYADDRSESRLRDLLPELAQVYGVNFISDAYWSCNPILTGLNPSSPKPLYYLLSDALPTPQRWDRRGRLIRLRDRNWFLDRPREVPLRLVHAWRDRISRDGALPLASFAEMATTLTDLQLDSLGSLVHDAGLPLDFLRAADGRFALRLWAALRSDQQQALRRAAAVPVARLIPDARVLLVRALAQKMEVPGGEIDREQLASGRLEADVTFLLREVRKDTGQLTVEDHSVWGANDGKTEPHSPPSVGRPVAPGPLRRCVANVIFFCRYGKEESEIGSVIVSTGD